MITLSVTSLNGTPVGDLAHTFDELGGSVGRGESNQFILPDPDRTISRVQAQIAFRGGTYVLVVRGANAVMVNGAEVGTGREAALADGYQIRMGGYVIEVSERRSPPKQDPFEALFGAGQGAPAAMPAVPPAPPQASPIARRPAAPAYSPPMAGNAPGGPAKGVPDDWDPFEQTPRNDAFEALRAAPASPGPGLSDLAVGRSSQEDSLDDLFGLGAGASPTDPFADPILAPPVAMPNTGAGTDPFRSLQKGPQAAIRTESDHVSDMQSPWVDSTPAPRRAPATGNPGSAGPVFSWDDRSRAVKSFGATTSFRAVPSADDRPAVPPARPVAALEPAAAASAAQARAPVAGEAELIAALVEGLGAGELPIQSLTPELMRLLGQLLRGATQGAVELLAARASLKREVRAQVTMIVAKANNPLKFSPNVEVALQHMLGPKMRGFMPPELAMRDAFDDLRAHQLGIMAGMDAALAGVLQRFDPAALESKLTSRVAIADLIPFSRKAKLWELFQALYKQLAVEAEDDFNALFGAAFLRAYEEYIDQIEKSGSQG